MASSLMQLCRQIQVANWTMPPLLLLLLLLTKRLTWRLVQKLQGHVTYKKTKKTTCSVDREKQAVEHCVCVNEALCGMNLWFTDTVPLSEHLSVVILCDAIDDWVASLIADVEVSGLCWVNDRHVLSCGSVGVHAWRLMTFAFMFSLISFVSHQNCTTCTCLAILGYVASLVSANVVGSYTNFNITAVSGGSDSSKSTIRQAIWLQFARVIHKSTQLQSTDVTTVLVVHHRKYFSSFGRVSDSRNSKLHSL